MPGLAISPSPAPLATPIFGGELQGGELDVETYAEEETTFSHSEPLRTADYQRRAVACLETAGIEKPIETLIHLYGECLHTEEDYQRGVKIEESIYRQMMHHQAYLRAIQEAAEKNPAETARLYRLGRTEEGRQRYGGEKYAQLAATMPPYTPPALEQYLAKFDAEPMEVHTAVYERARAMAEAAAPARAESPESD